jgi:hypothetical protein
MRLCLSNLDVCITLMMLFSQFTLFVVFGLLLHLCHGFSVVAVELKLQNSGFSKNLEAT